MTRNLITSLRALALMAGLALAGTAGAVAQSTATDSAEFVREFPMALVYQGIGLYQAGNYEGAITAWEEYVSRMHEPADTVGLGDLIRDAWIRQYPLSLVYDGYARYVANDIAGAVGSLERYIELAPAGEDTVQVREMIGRLLVPDETLARVNEQVSWFIKHELPGIMDALDGTVGLASARKGSHGSTLLMSRSKQRTGTK
jgi:hypothetical protein